MTREAMLLLGIVASLSLMVLVIVTLDGHPQVCSTTLPWLCIPV